MSPFPAALFCLLALSAPAFAETIGPDFWPDAPRGTLDLVMRFNGQGRWTSTNHVEFTNFFASRTANMHLRMLKIDETRLPIVAAPGQQAGPAGMSQAHQDVAAAIEACNGDLACQVQAAMRFSEAVPAPVVPAEGRYENWIPDRSRPCVSGELTVADNGDGVSISPPQPARPFNYTRMGIQPLANAEDRLIDRVCAAEISYDAETEQVSLRLPAYGLLVPTRYSGGYGGEEIIPLIEGSPEHFLILDQPSKWRAGAANGVITLDAPGTASVNSGHVTVPLRVEISWTFTPT